MVIVCDCKDTSSWSSWSTQHQFLRKHLSFRDPDCAAPTDEYENALVVSLGIDSERCESVSWSRRATVSSYTIGYLFSVEF